MGDAQEAVDFYTAAFDAVEIYRLDGDDGKVSVAQLAVDGAAFWGAGGFRNRKRARVNLGADDPLGGRSGRRHDRAVAAGATEVASVSEEYGWRTGRVTDPFGYDWELSRQLAE